MVCGCLTTVVTDPNLDMRYIRAEEGGFFVVKLVELFDVMDESSLQ